MEEAKAGIKSAGEIVEVLNEIVPTQDILNNSGKPIVAYECGFDDEEI